MLIQEITPRFEALIADGATLVEIHFTIVAANGGWLPLVWEGVDRPAAPWCRGLDREDAWVAAAVEAYEKADRFTGDFLVRVTRVKESS